MDAGSTCCAPKSAAHFGTTYKRGELVDFSWVRNNHPGVAPFDQSDEQNVFDRNTFHYNCHETDCHGSDPKDPLSGDGPGYARNKNFCTSQVAIPSHLPDGKYTIQWSQSGASSFEGNANTGQASYQSCMDFEISGGLSITAKDNCPSFNGGDASFPGSDKCLVFLAKGKKDVSVDGCWPDGCEGSHSSDKPLEFKQCAAKYGSLISTPTYQHINSTSLTSVLISSATKITARPTHYDFNNPNVQKPRVLDNSHSTRIASSIIKPTHVNQQPKNSHHSKVISDVTYPNSNPLLDSKVSHPEISLDNANQNSVRPNVIINKTHQVKTNGYAIPNNVQNVKAKKQKCRKHIYESQPKKSQGSKN